MFGEGSILTACRAAVACDSSLSLSLSLLPLTKCTLYVVRDNRCYVCRWWLLAAFPSMGRVDGMGWEGWVRPTPSIESVRCCGIAVNLQETSPLATRCGLFRGPATLSRICSLFLLCSPVNPSDAGVLFRTLRALYLKMIGPFWK